VCHVRRVCDFSRLFLTLLVDVTLLMSSVVGYGQPPPEWTFFQDYKDLPDRQKCRVEGWGVMAGLRMSGDYSGQESDTPEDEEDLDVEVEEDSEEDPDESEEDSDLDPAYTIGGLLRKDDVDLAVHASDDLSDDDIKCLGRSRHSRSKRARVRTPEVIDLTEEAPRTRVDVTSLPYDVLSMASHFSCNDSSWL
jgi:hypothetical protein